MSLCHFRGIHFRRSLIIGVAVCMLLVVLGGSALAHAEEIPEGSPSSPTEAGLQAACWVLSMPYGATKVAYAIGGGIVGGLAWAMTGGNMEVAKSVWIPSMTGDYIVQPQHLMGEKHLYFVGVSSEEPTYRRAISLMEQGGTRYPAHPKAETSTRFQSRPPYSIAMLTTKEDKP